MAQEFRTTEQGLRHRRHSPPRLAVAYLARNEGMLRLSDFAPALGVKNWAASHLVTSAERLANRNRRFRENLDHIRLSLSQLTDSQT